MRKLLRSFKFCPFYSDFLHSDFLHSDFRNHFLLNLAAHGDRIKRELRDRGLIADLLKLKLVGPLCVDKLRVERSPWQFPCE